MSTTAFQATPAGPRQLAAAPLAPRARRILESLQAQLLDSLANPLRLTLVELERDLFAQAERARNSQSQADFYAEMRRLKANGNRLAPAFKEQLEVELASLGQPRTPSADGLADTSMAMPLTLVEDTDIDRDIVLRDIARRQASQHHAALQLLRQRFGVLAASAALEIEEVPTGPHGLGRVLRAAGEALELGLDTQLRLYRAFEQQLSPRFGELIERANILLAHEGILPGLVYQPYLGRPAGTRKGAPRGPGKAGDKPHATPSRPLTEWTGHAPAASWAETMADLVSGPAAPAEGNVTTSGMAAGTQPGDAMSMATGGGGPAWQAAAGQQDALHAASTQPATADSAMSALHDLLHPARGGGAAGHAGATGAGHAVGNNGTTASSVVVPAAALANILGRLQALPPVASGGRRRSIADVRQALLERLRSEHGDNAALSQRDADTFDLLGMLYGEIQREVRSESPATELLVKLQVPVVRAAIQDSAFFVRDQHPARELLNAVAESGATWLAEEDTDPQLVAKLNQAVDRVVEDYQGDEAVLDEANRDVRAHFKAQARKAEVAERRHVEAARGKERLEASKQQATAEIAQVCAQPGLPRFVQSLLKQAWSDVLTLTLLRHGEESEEWSERRQTTDRIAKVTAGSGAPDIALGKSVEDALLQVGYHRDEAGAIARRLSTPGGEDEAISRTELTAKLKARARLGEQGDDETQKQELPKRSADEERCYAQLRTLPFGTWFEFITNQQGDARRQRLSWYSLITDNALFVNQRGQKINETSLDALARLMARGQLRIVTEERGRLIDRAWQATIRALRSLSGASAPTEALA